MGSKAPFDRPDTIPADPFSQPPHVHLSLTPHRYPSAWFAGPCDPGSPRLTHPFYRGGADSQDRMDRGAACHEEVNEILMRTARRVGLCPEQPRRSSFLNPSPIPFGPVCWSMRSWESAPRPPFYRGRADSQGRMDRGAACHEEVNETLGGRKKSGSQVMGLGGRSLETRCGWRWLPPLEGER
jgi:hypothetical protein